MLLQENAENYEIQIIMKNAAGIYGLKQKTLTELFDFSNFLYTRHIGKVALRPYTCAAARDCRKVQTSNNQQSC